MQNIDRIISDVGSSMAMEGMPLTEEDKTRIKRCLSDPGITDQIIQELLEKHTVPVKA